MGTTRTGLTGGIRRLFKANHVEPVTGSARVRWRPVCASSPRLHVRRRTAPEPLCIS